MTHKSSTEVGQITLARLDYISIDIDGVAGTVLAISDSGSQCNVIRSSLIEHIGLSPIGTICIRGIIGTPVVTPLILLNIKLHSQKCCVDDAYTSVVFAACEELNEDMILTIPVADQLYNAVQTVSVDDCMSSVEHAIVSVTTRAQSRSGFGAKTNHDTQTNDDVNSDVVDDDVLDVDDVTTVSRDCVTASSSSFAIEQHNDVTLNNAFELARLHKGG